MVSNNELAFFRTNFAIERSFLAMIRTVAIFIGLSLLLSEKIGNNHIAITLNTVTIFIGIFSIYNYLVSMNKLHLMMHYKFKFNVWIPVSYAVCLLSVQIALLLFQIKRF